jgi:hypothetical protein
LTSRSGCGPRLGKPEIDKFRRVWLDYGEPMGHVGFVVKRANERKLLSRWQSRLSDFVTLQLRCIEAIRGKTDGRIGGRAI